MLKWPAVKSPNETDYDYFVRIHQWAKSIFEWHTDQEVWNIPDLWPTDKELEASAQKYGIVYEDCDGFAQLCRYAIAQSGFNSRLVVCNQPGGRLDGNHCVAETEDGFVFDVGQVSLTTWETLIKNFGYEKVKMGSLCDPREPYLRDKTDWHVAL